MPPQVMNQGSLSSSSGIAASAKVWRLSALKACLLLLASALSIYILGPPLYWRFSEGMAVLNNNHHITTTSSSGSVSSSSSSTCPPCSTACDCSPESYNTDAVLLPGFTNHSTVNLDCAKADPSMKEELEKYSTDLLSEELKLQATVADESQQRADASLLEVKKLSSQYQKEAEKCNFGMETCEEAREKAEAFLIAQKKLTTLWEQRARGLGWKE